MRVISKAVSPTTGLPSSVTIGLGDNVERLLSVASAYYISHARLDPSCDEISLSLMVPGSRGAARLWKVNATALGLPPGAHIRHIDELWTMGKRAQWNLDLEFDTQS